MAGLVLATLFVLQLLPDGYVAIETKWTTCNASGVVNVTFDPAQGLTMTEGEEHTVSMYISAALLDLQKTLNVTSSDERIARIHDVTINDSVLPEIYYETGIAPNESSICDQLQTGNMGTLVVRVKVHGRRLGKCDVTLNLVMFTRSAPGDVSKPSQRAVLTKSYPVVVLRDVGLLDRIFHIVIQVLLAFINLAFGSELDLAVVASLLKKPLAPSIGFSSQFVFMPLLGLAVTQILHLDPVFGMGLISLACAPGGGASNSWTILLGGDVNLSLTMTFISLTLALGMMPLWMFIACRLYFDPAVVKVPYTKIVITLCLFVGPCFVGVILKKVRPKFAQPLSMIIKPLSVIFLVWVLTVGTYVNLYMWKIMGEYPVTIMAGILLPWCGFAFGFGFAFLARQGRERAIAIAIETGIQNMGVPIVLLQRSFPQPEGDLGATMVNSVAIFTPLPLFAALIVLTVRNRCINAKKNKQANVQQVLFIEKKEDVEIGAESSDTLFTSADGDVGVKTVNDKEEKQVQEDVT